MLANLQIKRTAAFTLTEIMLVAATIALLAAIAVPNYLRARKRSQAARIVDDLRMIDHALEIYAMEFRRVGSETIGAGDVAYIQRYIKHGTALYSTLPNDLLGNPFTLTDLSTPPKVNSLTFNALSDVAPSDFWSPYGP